MHLEAHACHYSIMPGLARLTVWLAEISPGPMMGSCKDQSLLVPSHWGSITTLSTNWLTKRQLCKAPLHRILSWRELSYWPTSGLAEQFTRPIMHRLRGWLLHDVSWVAKLNYRPTTLLTQHAISSNPHPSLAQPNVHTRYGMHVREQFARPKLMRTLRVMVFESFI